MIFSIESIGTKSDQEMIEFLIFGEFFENAEGVQGCHFTSSFLFLYTSK